MQQQISLLRGSPNRRRVATFSIGSQRFVETELKGPEYTDSTTILFRKLKFNNNDFHVYNHVFTSASCLQQRRDAFPNSRGGDLLYQVTSLSQLSYHIVYDAAHAWTQADWSDSHIVMLIPRLIHSSNFSWWLACAPQALFHA